MAKPLTVLSLILAIVLFPPAVLAVVSNNAVPGDATYPIKRGLEDVIFAIASINPATKAWFAAARSDRRFVETVILVDKNLATVSQSLDELVSQTEIAAREIEQVNNPAQKEKLKKQLVESINGYNQKLSEIKSRVESQQAQNPPPVVTNPTPAPAREVGPTPQPVIQNPPTTAPQPATPVPQVPFGNSGDGLAGQISDAQNRLGDIGDKLQLESQKDNQEDKQKKDQDKKEKEKEDKGKNNSAAENLDKNHAKSANEADKDKKAEKDQEDLEMSDKDDQLKENGKQNFENDHSKQK